MVVRGHATISWRPCNAISVAEAAGVENGQTGCVGVDCMYRGVGGWTSEGQGGGI